MRLINSRIPPSSGRQRYCCLLLKQNVTQLNRAKIVGKAVHRRALSLGHGLPGGKKSRPSSIPELPQVFIPTDQYGSWSVCRASPSSKESHSLLQASVEAVRRSSSHAWPLAAWGETKPMRAGHRILVSSGTRASELCSGST